MVLAPEIAGPAEALRRLAASRDADAWAWLLAQAGPEIHRVAMRLTGDAASADDAVQECLLTLRDHAGGFTPRGDPDRDAMRWIVRVAANAALQGRRRRQRAVARDRDHAVGSAANAEDPVGAGIERDETALLVRDELSRLGESERAAIVLHVVAGMSYDQVAAELRCPVGTAKVRVHRGLERLRRRLGRRANDLSVAGVAAGLQQGAPSSATADLGAHHVLLGSPAHASINAVPTTIGVFTMATKLALAAAALLVAAAPIAMRLHAQERSPIVAPAIPPTVAAMTMTDRLDRRVTFEFVDTSLDEAAEYFRAMGVPCRWDAAGKGALTMTVKDMRTGDAVRWIARLSGASMKIADGAIVLFPTPLDQRVLLDTLIELPRSALTVAEALQAVRLATGIAIEESASAKSDAQVTVTPGSRTASDLLADIARQSGDPLRVEASGVTFGNPAPGPVRLSQAPAAVAAVLAQQVTLDFSDSDFVDTVQFLQRITNLNIVVDPRVMASQLKSVTLKSEAKPLSDVIEAIASVNALSVQWRDQAVFITIGDPAPTAPIHTF